ncbi:MAG: hypothetical protein CM15mP78_09780 [Candidatus Poseidoniales archaeon]|nr:MAG: hypothetical protein CM15mP78_09780 [Candidatus Poseidoniales archaeon]
MAFGLQVLKNVLLKQTDGFLRSTVVLAVVLFVTDTPVSSNLQRVSTGCFGTPPSGFTWSPRTTPVHGSTSIGVVRFGVGLGLQALALTDFPDDLVKELGWENLEAKVLRVPHGSSLRCSTDVV